MKIFNSEKLDGHNVVVMTGRSEHVREVAEVFATPLYCLPRNDDYFMDYPGIVEKLQRVLSRKTSQVVVTTQSAEFLDCLLTSNIDFVLATVRKFERDEDDVYRLRVLTKEEAWKDRRDFNMELRI